MSESSLSFDGGRVSVDTVARQLVVQGRPTKIGGRAFDVLQVLVANRGRVVTKSELMDRVWPNLFVEENNLHVQVLMLRRAMGAAAIVTVSGRGYRLALKTDGPPPRADPAGPAAEQPKQTSGLVGREPLVAAVLAEFGQHATRLVTLCGPGGAGKTRVALHIAARVANERAGGAFVVALANEREADNILPSLAAVLELKEGSAEAALRCLHESEALLVLDNLEHLEGAGEVVARLLARCPRVQVLATSRMALNLTQERSIHVQPLELPHDDTIEAVRRAPAVTLFALRAERLGRALSGDPGEWLAAARICRRLEGMPLAIELAAARLTTLSPIALEQRLARALPLLVGGAADAHPRQRTMRRSIAWSVDLLDAPAQRLFRRLGVFAGGFSLAAAVGVDAEPETTLDRLEVLVARHLLQRDVDVDGQPRYRLLETVREFAVELLVSFGELEACTQAHARYFCEWAEQLAQPFAENEPVRGRALYFPDRANVTAAMEWCLADPQRADMAATLFVRMRPVWYYSNESHLAQAWYGRLSPTCLAREKRAEVLLAGATVALELRELGLVRERAACAKACALDSHDAATACRADLLLARAEADPARAAAGFERAAAGFAAIGMRRADAQARWLSACRAVLEAWTTADAALVRSCRDRLLAEGVKWAATESERLLAWLDLRQGKLDSLLRRVAEVEAVAAAAENGIGLAEAWHLQARAAAIGGQWDIAARWEHRAIRILIAESEGDDALRHLRWLAYLHLCRGDLASCALLMAVDSARAGSESFIALGTLGAEDRSEWQHARAELERLLPAAQRDHVGMRARGWNVETAVAASEQALASAP
jgi:predicted ATPase/DNA-binding winged helix-turn-helix (wHTH) protein